jgi:hypothetical protein
MRYWHLLSNSIDVSALMASVARQRELWSTETPLQQFAPPFRETQSVLLRFPKDIRTDPVECIFHPAWYLLPEAHRHVFGLMSLVCGVRLGRVFINRLPPDAVISRHTDMPEHTSRWKRYHLVLHGLPGASMQVEDETVPMLTGMLFWFDNAAAHEVINRSADDRISMVIDIQTCELGTC